MPYLGGGLHLAVDRLMMMMIYNNKTVEFVYLFERANFRNYWFELKTNLGYRLLNITLRPKGADRAAGENLVLLLLYFT